MGPHPFMHDPDDPDHCDACGQHVGAIAHAGFALVGGNPDADC